MKKLKHVRSILRTVGLEVGKILLICGGLIIVIALGLVLSDRYGFPGKVIFNALLILSIFAFLFYLSTLTAGMKQQLAVLRLRLWLLDLVTDLTKVDAQNGYHTKKELMYRYNMFRKIDFDGMMKHWFRGEDIFKYVDKAMLMPRKPVSVKGKKYSKVG